MSIFDSFGILRNPANEKRKACKACYESGDYDRPEDAPYMEPTETWHPRLASYVDSWECPKCGRTVIRGEEPTIHTPDGESF